MKIYANNYQNRWVEIDILESSRDSSAIVSTKEEIGSLVCDLKCCIGVLENFIKEDKDD